MLKRIAVALLAGSVGFMVNAAERLPGCFPVTVVSVYDGDTFTGQVRPWRPGWIAEEDYRLEGVNAPELKKGPCRDAGRAARDHLAGMIQGKTVTVCGVSFEDLYGRVLGQVMADGIDVAAAMIQAGHAVAYNGEGKAGTWCPAPR